MLNLYNPIINLNKFTKAELINKFKKLESNFNKNSNNFNNNQSIFSKILEYIIQFKALILKITLLAVIIKYFKKYSFFSRLFRFTNWIILSIFGISLMDNLGFDVLSNIFTEFRLILSGIILYFSNTQFYSFVASIFKTKEDISSKPKISLNTESTRIEQTNGQSKGNSKILEWLKPEEVKEETNNNKYYIIAGIFILTCLSWYYWDEVRDGLNWFRSRNPRSGDNGGRNTGTINQPVENRVSIKERLQDTVNKKINNITSDIKLEDVASTSDIILEDKTPQIENTVSKSSNIASTSTIKIDEGVNTSPDSLDHFFPKMDGSIAANITGYSQIEHQSEILIQSIDLFNKQYKTNDLPDWDAREEIYHRIRNQLTVFAAIYSGFYANWMKSPSVENKIDQFINLEDILHHNYEPIEQGSDSYNDVADATIHEQEVWSDKAPSPKVLSPQTSNIDQVLSLVQENIENRLSPEMMSYAIEDQQVSDYRKELLPNPDIPSLLQQIKSKRLEYSGTPDSTPSPIQQNEDKTSFAIDNREWLEPFMDKLEKVKGKQPVVDNTSVVDVITKDDNNNNNKPTLERFINEMEDVGYWDDNKNKKWSNPDLINKNVIASSSKVKLDEATTSNPIPSSSENKALPQINIDTSSDESVDQYFPEPLTTQEEVKTGFASLFQQIRSKYEEKNKQASSPVISQIGLSPKLSNKPSISNLLEDTQALFEVDDIIETSNNIEKIITSNVLENLKNEDGKIIYKVKGLKHESFKDANIEIKK